MKRLDRETHLISISRVFKRADVDVSEIRFRGAVRAKTVESFRTFLDQAGARSRYLVVDLSELEYIGSGGIGALLAQAAAQERNQGWLRLIAPSTSVTMILSLAGVLEKLPALDSVDNALKDLPARAA